MLLFFIITGSVLLFKARQWQRRHVTPLSGEWLWIACIRQSSSEKCLFGMKRHRLKKRKAVQRRRDPDGRDSRGNKTHQTLMPTMLPLIRSYSNQILTDAVSLCVTQTGLCLCAFYWLDYSGRRAWDNSFSGEGMMCLYSLGYAHT